MVCEECDVLMAQKHHCKQCLSEAVPASSAPPVLAQSPFAIAPAPRRLYRSSTDRVIGGVCGGFARYADVDPALVRIVVAVSMLAGLSLLAYVLAWVVIPLEETAVSEA
jgi:phage shock protein C